MQRMCRKKLETLQTFKSAIKGTRFSGLLRAMLKILGTFQVRFFSLYAFSPLTIACHSS